MADVWLHIKADNIDQIEKRLNSIEEALGRIEKGYNLKFNTSGMSTATRQISQIESAAKRVESVFSGIGRAIQGAGGAMQNLSNLFGGRVVGTVKTMATAFGTMGLWSAAQGTVTRYDTMRMYPKQMELLGFRADQAAASVDKLEQSVIGLPTGLDEIVESARQLVTLTGDLNKGTDLAIAANNALLAGGADTQQQVWGQRQIRDLLSAGKLRSQEWESLIKALGPGLKDIGEAMGYADYGQFRSELKQNKVAAEDFLDALVQVGTGEGVLAQRAELYKDTLSATARNIKNAVQKLGAAGLDALDKVLENETGKNLPQTIVEISDAIKGRLVPALEGWIGDHSGDIVNFLDRLKNYDWIGLVSKVGDGLAKYYDIMTNFFTKVNPDIVAFLAVWAGPIGRMLQTAGGAVSGFGGVIGNLIRFFGKGKARQLEEAAEGAGALSRTARSFKSAFQGLGLAAGGVALVGEIGLVIAEYAKIIEMISNIDMGDNFGKNIDKISKVAGVATLIAASLTTIMTAVASSGIGAAATAAGEGLAAGLIGIVAEIGGVVAEYVNIVDKVAKMELPSNQKFKELGKTVGSLSTEVLGKVKKIPNNKVRSLDNLAEATGYVTDIATQLKKLREVGQVGDMSKRLEKIFKAADVMLNANITKSDKSKSKIIKETTGNLAEGMKSIKDIAQSLMDARSNISELVKDHGMDVLKFDMGTIFTALVGRKQDHKGVLTQLESATAEFEMQKDNLASLSESINSVATIFDTLLKARDTIAQLATGKDASSWESVNKTIGDVLGGIKETFVQFSEAGLYYKGQFIEGEAIDYDNIYYNIHKLSQSTKSLSNITKNLIDVMANLDSLVAQTTHGKTFHLEDRDFKRKVDAVINPLTDVLTEIEEKNIDPNGDAEGKVTALAKTIGQLPALMTALQQVQEPLSALGVSGEEWPLGKDIGTLIKGVQGAFENLSSSDYKDLSDNATALKEACDQLAPIFTALQNVQTNIGSLGIADGVWQAGENLGIAIRTITGIFDNTKSIGAGANVGQLLGDAASNLSAIAETLGTLATNAGDAASQLKSAAEQLANLGNMASTHKQSIEDAGKAAQRLKSGVNGIGGLARSAATGVSILGSAAQAQIGSLRAAASAARNLAGAINSIPSSKTVSISVNGNTANENQGGVVGALSRIKGAFGLYRGGVVYRAGGGTLFRPRGSDTIPAMLTPGEFVMQRRAHSAFGTEFMKRVNALDVDGAMRALSLRAGSGVFRRAAITNNYTRDNHANVTFNVNRATQGYSQRRASRWARALS